jgi:MscS family membrane protein
MQNTINSLLQNSWAGQTLLQWVLSMGVLVFILFFNGPLARLINMLVYRAFSERDIERRRLFNRLTGKPLRRVLVFVALMAAFTILNIPSKVVWFGKPLRIHFYIDILLQLGLVWYGAKTLLKVADFVADVWQQKAAKDPEKVQDQWVPYIKDGIKVGVMLSAFLFVIGIVFQANIAALIGGLGIGGLAVALAAQESLANLLGSFTIFLDKPFTVGDTIEFKGITGTVENVGFRSTRLRTLDKSFVTIPNKALVTEPLNNITESTHRRASFQLGLVYQTSPETLRTVIQEIKSLLNQHPMIDEHPVVSFFG